MAVGFGGRGCVCQPAVYQAAPAAAVQAPAPAAPAVAAAPATSGYRSYSYQPGAPAAPAMAPAMRSYQPASRPFYSYPKSDPRRYQHN